VLQILVRVLFVLLQNIANIEMINIITIIVILNFICDTMGPPA